MSTSSTEFTPVLSYLGLPSDYQPSPDTDPLKFLTLHLRLLPPQMLQLFSPRTTPNQRTIIPAIRNRRHQYALSAPKELDFANARNTWSSLWLHTGGSVGRLGEAEGQDERQWAQRDFMEGAHQQVGKLGVLLGDYAEGITAEHAREERRARRQAVEEEESEFVPEEEDSDEDEDEDEEADPQTKDPPETPQQMQARFERTVRERFIYGLLDSINYDEIDWDDKWDAQNDQEAEDRWFDEEEEGD